jgi:hypothetical protein
VSDYIDELVNSACCCRLNASEPHADHCDRERLASFARAVAERVKAEHAAELAALKAREAALSVEAVDLRARVAEVLDNMRKLVELAAAREERLRKALDRIASWSEGDEVTGSFDEPCSARTARAALAPDAGGEGTP